jgi:DNA-binding MarR family transcriptional regulator
MSQRSPGVAFLLAQIGAAATARFAAAIEPLGLTPAQAGVLRLVASSPGASQREMAARLGAAPSRVVGLLDELESRGAVARQPGPDRRVNLVTLTDAGRALLAELSAVAQQHDATITAALTERQRDQLQAHLCAIADQLNLTPQVHPGYRDPRQDGSPTRQRRTTT